MPFIFKQFVKYHTFYTIYINNRNIQSGLLVEETGVSGENHRPAVSHLQTLSHNVVAGWDSNSQR
jgi:hypothetical protein